MTHRTPDPRAPSHAPDHDANRVVIFDTTLRDGEQSPGASMTLEEKLEVADLLDALGVDVIEALARAAHGNRWIQRRLRARDRDGHRQSRW